MVLFHWQLRGFGSSFHEEPRVVCFMVGLLGHKINRCTYLKDCDKDRIDWLLMTIVEGHLRQLSQSKGELHEYVEF